MRRAWERNTAPFIPGMRMSEITTSNGPCSPSAAMPASPPIAVITSKCSPRLRSSASSTLGSSSTQSTRAVVAVVMRPPRWRVRPVGTATSCRHLHRGFPGNAHDERRAATELGLEGDRAAVLLDHHVVGDRQALAGTLADALGREERIEDPAARGLGNASAGVAHADLAPVLVGTRA